MNMNVKAAIESEYTILQTLDEDIYSSQSYHVYLAAAKTDIPQFFSLKEIDNKRAGIYQKLCGRNHPNLASIYEVRSLCSNISDQGSDGPFTDSETECPEYLAIMEFVHGRSLFEYVLEEGPLKPEKALLYASQIAKGLSFLHEMNLVHKDIKPENIIITRDEESGEELAKIIDLGIAEIYDSKKIYGTEFGGTRGYRAPEVNDYTASPRSDVFSLGCVLNFMLCGSSPSEKHYSGIYELENIIDKAVALNEAARYRSVNSMIRSIEHAQGRYLLSRIPLVRTLPGFRSHSLKNMLVACLVYLYALASAGYWLFKGDYRNAFLQVFFYILIPWILCFDGFGIFRFIPRRWRINRNITWPYKALVISLCILLSFLLGSGFPEGI